MSQVRFTQLGILALSLMAGASLILNTGCGAFGGGSDSSSASSTALPTIVLSSSTGSTALTSDQSVVLTASGGSGSYSSLVLTPATGCGTVTGLTATASATATATYVAPSVSAETDCTLTLTDSVSEVTTLTFIVGGSTSTTTGTGTGSDGISLTAASTSVALNGTTSLSATGGVPPYSWSSSSGSVLGTNGPYNTFTGGSTSASVTVTVTDSNNYSTSVVITVGTPAGTGTTAAAVCAGKFTWVTGSTTSTLTLLEDGNGNVAGYFGASDTAVSGTCGGSTLTFAEVSDPALSFSGTYYTSQSNSSVIVFGTYNGQTSMLTPQ
jgi:hypothetical protein